MATYVLCKYCAGYNIFAKETFAKLSAFCLCNDPDPERKGYYSTAWGGDKRHIKACKCLKYLLQAPVLKYENSPEKSKDDIADIYKRIWLSNIHHEESPEDERSESSKLPTKRRSALGKTKRINESPPKKIYKLGKKHHWKKSYYEDDEEELSGDFIAKDSESIEKRSSTESDELSYEKKSPGKKSSKKTSPKKKSPEKKSPEKKSPKKKSPEKKSPGKKSPGKMSPKKCIGRKCILDSSSRSSESSDSPKIIRKTGSPKKMSQKKKSPIMIESRNPSPKRSPPKKSEFRINVRDLATTWDDSEDSERNQ
jgi:penicillin-insensitive murein endopeptidase